MSRALRVAWLPAVLVLAGLLVGFHADVQHWLAVHLGLLSAGPDHFYNFWSGFGSDLGEYTVPVGLIALYVHHQCHTKGCWRVGKHPAADGLYKLCKKCHPDVPNSGASREHIHEQHRRSQEETA